MPGFETPRLPTRIWLTFESAILFVGVPAMAAMGWLPVPIIPLLLIATAGCALTLRWRHGRRFRDVWNLDFPNSQWRRIFRFYLIAVPALVVLLWFIKPGALWSLMTRHTMIWVLVMLAYPLVSVVPQELIYRVFFFERYRPLFGRGRSMVLASAAVFSFAHIVFQNWMAIFLTFPGGLLFAYTYRRAGSLLLVSAEHALYGCAIFTIGYGEFFFAGTLRLFR
jgi:membrane protease YdiL (CAAX protease family)